MIVPAAPDLSIIIPVFRAQDTLARALASIDVPAGVNAEIILSVDDGDDYSAFAHENPMVRLITSPEQRTGTGTDPGPARNRGVAAARGAFLAYLDADDSWSPGYLAALLPLARHEGCAFAATVIETPEGRALAQFPPGTPGRLMLPDFARWGASFHPVHAAGLPRGRAEGPFWNAPAQDVMHAVEVFMACGLTAALETSVAYRLRLGAETVTTASDFSDRLRAAYAAYDRALAETWAQTLFAGKSALNDRYQREQVPGESFYAFVTRVIVPEASSR
ncbi:MAG: glycosyltransferase family 2 protein [Pseudomonadota bacterium]|nr:glycosyltransferase family 2 protein [Pseudomonadota bacterium]